MYDPGYVHWQHMQHAAMQQAAKEEQDAAFVLLVASVDSQLVLTGRMTNPVHASVHHE